MAPVGVRAAAAEAVGAVEARRGTVAVATAAAAAAAVLAVAAAAVALAEEGWEVVRPG